MADPRDVRVGTWCLECSNERWDVQGVVLASVADTTHVRWVGTHDGQSYDVQHTYSSRAFDYMVVQSWSVVDPEDFL